MSAASATPVCIAVEDLTFGYHDRVLFSHVSFTIEKGAFVALIGPNGGGKTTLFKLLLGFQEPNKGRITVCGQPIRQAVGLIGYVPQKLSFDRQFPISVLEVVLTGRLAHLPWYGRYSRLDRALALEALEKVKLVDFANHPFGALSGGQAQRTLLARALAGNPQILLLDEPTSHIDVPSQQALYSLLADLKGSMTLLMVTHDLAAVLSQVDRVFCVQGNVIPMKSEEICQHFALGLYHPPLTLSSSNGALKQLPKSLDD